ncbi:GFA family protein [Yunchengibacter salinarum]|uniref:GFA family protein n=1 Tax=Yunchengibacter salinarum TaxID=3133399 RepID=UPI0035B6A099
MTEPVSYTGACLCGAVQISAAADPLWVGHCHCPTCRRATGAAFTTFARFDRAMVRFSGREVDVFRPSPDAARLFCSKCGSPVALKNERVPNLINVQIGVLDQAADLVPEEHTYVKTRLPWVDMNADLPSCQLFPGMKA